MSWNWFWDEGAPPGGADDVEGGGGCWSAEAVEADEVLLDDAVVAAVGVEVVAVVLVWGAAGAVGVLVCCWDSGGILKKNIYM